MPMASVSRKRSVRPARSNVGAAGGCAGVAGATDGDGCAGVEAVAGGGEAAVPLAGSGGVGTVLGFSADALPFGDAGAAAGGALPASAAPRFDVVAGGAVGAAAGGGASLFGASPDACGGACRADGCGAGFCESDCGAGCTQPLSVAAANSVASNGVRIAVPTEVIESHYSSACET